MAIHIGKNKEHNFELIDAAAPTDLWFHVQNIPSAHVILEIAPGVKPDRSTLKQCALLCKAHSKAKNEKRVAIIYTEIMNVRKTGTIGKVDLSEQPKIIMV